MQKQNRSKLVLGITGNIGSGKTTVAKMFLTKDCLLIDADREAHKLLLKKDVYDKIVSFFGKKILDPSGRISRRKLARAVFPERKYILKLNKIIHPELITEIKQKIKNSSKKIIVLDAALIVEAGLKKIADKIILVDAKKNQRIERKAKNNFLTRKEVALRMKSQFPQNRLKLFADFIIDNSKQIGKTREQVAAVKKVLPGFLDQKIRMTPMRGFSWTEK